MRLKGKILSAAVLIMAGALTGCDYFEKKDGDGDSASTPPIIIGPIPDDPPPGGGSGGTSYEYQYVYMPDQLEGRAQVCQNIQSTYTYNYYGYTKQQYAYYCYQDTDHHWHNTCQSGACQEVPIFVHYMIDEDLGDGRTVQIEAFTDKTFQGQPKATVEIASFKATRGEWAETSLYLDPGEYYLRAYLTTRDEQRIPYNFQGMELVAKTPIGVYGALSSPQSIRVKPSYEGAAEPLHIMLDQLFHEPGTEPPTEAHLRLKLTMAAPERVEAGDKVRIRLYESEDLERDPIYDFDMLSELFMVQGRVGTAEFVSPSLRLGDYIVFTFLDEDNNGFYDEGEPKSLYSENGEARLVRMEQNKTRTLELTLGAE